MLPLDNESDETEKSKVDMHNRRNRETRCHSALKACKVSISPLALSHNTVGYILQAHWLYHTSPLAVSRTKPKCFGKHKGGLKEVGQTMFQGMFGVIFAVLTWDSLRVTMYM